MASNVFVCNVCEKVFSNKTYLQRHVTTHTPYQICGKVPLSLAEIKKHEILHQNQQEHKRQQQIQQYQHYHQQQFQSQPFQQQLLQQVQQQQQFQQHIQNHQSFQLQQLVQRQQQFQQHIQQQQQFHPQSYNQLEYLYNQPFPTSQPNHYSFQQLLYMWEQGYPMEYLQQSYYQHEYPEQQQQIHKNAYEGSYQLAQSQPVQYYQQAQYPNMQVATQQLEHFQPETVKWESNEKQHIMDSPQNPSHIAHLLDTSVSSSSFADRELEHPIPSTSSAAREPEICVSAKVKQIESEFNNRIATYRYQESCDVINIDEYLRDASKYVKKLTVNSIAQHHVLKLQIVFNSEYMKVTDSVYLLNIYHKIKMGHLTRGSNVDEAIASYMLDLKEKLSTFDTVRSGLTLLKIENIDIFIFKCALSRGSNFIRTPDILRLKKACLNIQNTDEFCFKWCIIAALGRDGNKNPERCRSYDIDDIRSNVIRLKNGAVLKFETMKFPLDLKDVKIFESQNDISINVFGYENNQVVGPFYLTQGEKDVHVNLLLLEENGKSHYILVNNISRLLTSQITSHNQKLYLCNTCLHYTHEERLSLQHKEVCSRVVTHMPTMEEAVLEYRVHHRQIDVPFVIYAHIECVLSDVPQGAASSTSSKFLKKHTPCAFSFKIKCHFDSSLDKLVKYVGTGDAGENVAKTFVDRLKEELTVIYDNHIRRSQQKAMIDLTPLELIQHRNAKICHICGKGLGAEKVIRDHCHFTGKYRGPAHNKCNLIYRIPKFIPIYFHNFSGHDSHLFIKELIEGSQQEVKVLPLNKDLHISLSQTLEIDEENSIELRFLDTFTFMPASLDALAANLCDNQLLSIHSHFQNNNDFSLMRRKGVFPHEYLNSCSKLRDKQLPPRAEFFSHLNNKECSLEDYSHAQKVWETLKCATLRDYLELYVVTDVLLLTDVFENFRKICKQMYLLDPSQYYTTPALTWDVMLKTTNVQLDLLTDLDMYNLFKSNIRGGIRQCSKRYTRANNKYLPEYEPNEPSEYLMYWHTNNLYGWAMSQYLPHGEFEWVEDFSHLCAIEKIPDNSPIGYVYVVDLVYPYNIHDAHNDLPFCAENKKFGGSKYKKLLTDLSDKFNYPIHYRLLKQCLKHGLILKKIHRVISFKQSAWLKEYIDVNNDHKTSAKNSFEKYFFELLNNSVYDKIVENVDERKNVRIVSQWEKTKCNKLGASNLISKPNFHSASRFSDNIWRIQMNRTHVKYLKPIYLEFCVQELSKWKMYDFHYEYMKPKFKSNFNLNYMDTDLFIYSIKSEDVYEDLKADIASHFDTSEYPIDNQYDIPILNKKAVGMMKDKHNGKVMTEFVGLGAKMYSFTVNDDIELEKAKGVKESSVAETMIGDYKECIFNHTQTFRNMVTFKCRYVTYTHNLKQLLFSHKDTKRKIKNDKINTYAWSHCEIRQNSSDTNKNCCEQDVSIEDIKREVVIDE